MKIINDLIKNIKKEEVHVLKDKIEIKDGKISSINIASNMGVNMSIIAIAKSEELSTHTANGDAFVYVLEGSSLITIDGKEFTLEEGNTIIMPKGIPHSVHALSDYKMLLVVVR